MHAGDFGTLTYMVTESGSLAVQPYFFPPRRKVDAWSKDSRDMLYHLTQQSCMYELWYFRYLRYILPDAGYNDMAF